MKLAIDPETARMNAFLLVFPKDWTTNVDIKKQILPNLGWNKNVYGCVKRAALKAGKIERKGLHEYRLTPVSDE